MAIGLPAEATAGGAVALGNASIADQANTVSVGTDIFKRRIVNVGEAVDDTNAANRVTLGGTGSSVRIGDLAASTLAQQGPVDAVTVDQHGTLGRQQVATAASVQNVRISVNALSQVTDAQFGQLESSILALEGRVSGLEFQLQEVDERLTGGIAASMALGGQMVVPDSTVSFSLNASTYHSEQGFAGSLSARVAEKVYISAGLAGSTAPDSTGGRIGVAFGF